MAQFDVYENSSKTTKRMFPLLLDIQHEIIADINTRLIIPLAKPEFFKQHSMTRLMPAIEYDGQDLLLLTPQLTAVSVKQLKQPIGTLEHIRDDIIAALDLAISGI